MIVLGYNIIITFSSFSIVSSLRDLLPLLRQLFCHSNSVVVSYKRVSKIHVIVRKCSKSLYSTFPCFTRKNDQTVSRTPLNCIKFYFLTRKPNHNLPIFLDSVVNTNIYFTPFLARCMFNCDTRELYKTNKKKCSKFLKCVQNTVHYGKLNSKFLVLPPCQFAFLITIIMRKTFLFASNRLAHT